MQTRGGSGASSLPDGLRAQTSRRGLQPRKTLVSAADASPGDRPLPSARLAVRLRAARVQAPAILFAALVEPCKTADAAEIERTQLPRPKGTARGRSSSPACLWPAHKERSGCLRMLLSYASPIFLPQKAVKNCALKWSFYAMNLKKLS